MDILELVFPKKCLECGREGKYICSLCLSKVRTSRPICPKCERPSADGLTHFKCKRKLGLDGLVSIWEYDGVIRKAILALKYKFALEVAKELAENLVSSLKNGNFVFPQSPVTVPVPLHWYRGNWRGFNQSEEIGRLIAQDLGWQFIPDLLIRKKLTVPQTELKEKERMKNTKGVFALNLNYLLPGAYCLTLFDDVWTTGSTLKEACKVLKRAGAKSVWGLTIAR